MLLLLEQTIGTFKTIASNKDIPNVSQLEAKIKISDLDKILITLV